MKKEPKKGQKMKPEILWVSAPPDNRNKVSPYDVMFEGKQLDPYVILKLYGITNPAQQHAIKKLLRAGKGGSKSWTQDMMEAAQSIKRGVLIEEGLA